jgi:X-X-X-Leu-X-X-Gly heptad repeat protein
MLEKTCLKTPIILPAESMANQSLNERIDRVFSISKNRSTLLGLRVDRVGRNVTELKGEFIKLKEGMAELQRGAVEVNGKVTQLQNGMAELQRGAVEVNGKVTQLQNGMAELQRGAVEVNGKVTQLQNGVATLIQKQAFR